MASVFTREFYAAARARLRPGGLFAQWVQGYEVGVSTLRIVMKTLRTVFPHVEAWHTQTGDFLLLAALEPMTVDVPRLRARLREPPVYAAATRTFLTEEAEGILGHFVADEALIAAIAEKAYTPVNTDDSSALEYEFARRVGAGDDDLVARLLALAAARGADRPAVRGDVDWARVVELRPRAAMIARDSLGPPPADPELRRRILTTQAACGGDLRLAAERWGDGPFPVRDGVERYVSALLAAKRGDPRAAALAAALEGAGFRPEAATVRAHLALAQRRPDAALDRAAEGLAELRVEGLPLCSTPALLLGAVEAAAPGDEARLRRAVELVAAGPLAAWQNERSRLRLWRRLASVHPDPSLCAAAFAARADQPEWSDEYLRSRLACWRRAQDPRGDRAEAELLRFVSRGPGDLAAGLD